jgi:hypothetical protein
MRERLCPWVLDQGVLEPLLSRIRLLRDDDLEARLII